MPGLTDYDCEGTLTIDGISMNRPAWGIIPDENGNGGLLQVITTVDVRGEDRVLPGASGVIPYRRRRTATRYTFRLIVTGDVDENGNPNADAKMGLIDNLLYLRDNVVDPLTTGDGTVPAIWTLPDASTLEADVHVMRCEQNLYGYDPNDVQAYWIGSLLISSPSGWFLP